MNRLELIKLLSLSDEEEVFIQTREYRISDFEFDHLEEQFDGFDEVTPAAIVLKPTDKNSEI